MDFYGIMSVIHEHDMHYAFLYNTITREIMYASECYGMLEKKVNINISYFN